MSAGYVGDVVQTFGSMYLDNSTNRSAASADVIAVAVSNKTIETATEAMQQQYSRFLDVFA